MNTKDTKMSEKAVFIFVSAGNCGGCIRFKKDFWDKTKVDLSKIPGLHVSEVAVLKIGDSLPPNAHKDLVRFVSWYPTFILVSKASYDKGKLEGVVFNGVENKTKWELVPLAQRKPTDQATVVSWVKQELADNSLFKKGVSFGSLGLKSIPKGPKMGRNPEFSDDSDDDEIYTQTYCEQAFVPFS